MKTIIEVGGHDGKDTERLLDGGANRVFTFEPLPDLYAKLQARFSGNESLFLVPHAVDLEEQWRWFNVVIGKGTGVSSLHEMNPDTETVWPGVFRKFGARQRVWTTRLDTFIRANAIETIDYLWIDAQGNDWRVLQSLGDEIARVIEGKCEAANTFDLYLDVDNRVSSIAPWLQQRGFDVAFVPDGSYKEGDVHFRRRQVRF